MTWNEWTAEWKNKSNYFGKGELIATFDFGSYNVLENVYSEILEFSKLFGKDANMIYGFCGKTGNSRLDIFAGCFNIQIILMMCTVPASSSLVYWNNRISRPPRYEEDEMTMFNTITSIWEDIKKQPKQHSQSGGCYIATACYGSYDCTQVLTFRNFRDEYLNRTLAGRMFIKTYYALSPSFAKWLENQYRINTFIRENFLEPIYKFLKNKY